MITVNYLLQLVTKNPTVLRKLGHSKRYDLFNRNITIDKEEIKQKELAEMLNALRAYPARGSKYTDLK